MHSLTVQVSDGVRSRKTRAAQLAIDVSYLTAEGGGGGGYCQVKWKVYSLCTTSTGSEPSFTNNSVS